MATLDTIECRAKTYRVLSDCFHAPDQHLLDVLAEADIPDLCSGVWPTLLELQQDYAHLFVGPFRVPAPPYGSVYLENDRRTCGDSTMDVIARYQREGLRFTLKEPADHIAAELEYMYLLVFQQMQAADAGDEDSATRYFEKQADFLQTHLGAWMPQLRQKIVENARTDFYRYVATVTDNFVRQELDHCHLSLLAGGGP